MASTNLRRSDITNLSLQDEEKLSYATYFEALETFSKTPQVVRTTSASAQFFKKHKTLNAFQLLVTLPNNTEAGKKSVPLTHPIGYDRSQHNTLMRDRE